MSLRYFNVFGPRQDPKSEYAAVIPRFITAAIRRERRHRLSDGEQTRDFCFIENAVRANLLAAGTQRKLAGEVVNVACGEKTSLNQLLKSIAELAGARIDPEYRAARAGDVRDSLADVRAAREPAAYEAKVDARGGQRTRGVRASTGRAEVLVVAGARLGWRWGVAAVGVRALVALALLGAMPMVSDALDYFDVGAKFAAGDASGAFYWPPGEGLTLAAAFAAFGTSLVVARLATIATSTATVVLGALLARELGGERAGRAAGWIGAFYVPSVLLCGQTYAQHLASLCLAASGHAGGRCRNASDGRWFRCGWPCST